MGNRRSDDKQTKRMGNGGKFNQSANRLKNERLCREPLLGVFNMSNDRACSISTVEVTDFMTGLEAATYAFASYFVRL